MKRALCLALFAMILCPPPAAAQDGEDYTHEQCVADWKAIIPTISDEEANRTCKCFEDEMDNSPVSADKGSMLSGSNGLDNAGPWPAIMQNCLFGANASVPETKE